MKKTIVPLLLAVGFVFVVLPKIGVDPKNIVDNALQMAPIQAQALLEKVGGQALKQEEEDQILYPGGQVNVVQSSQKSSGLSLTSVPKANQTVLAIVEYDFVKLGWDTSKGATPSVGKKNEVWLVSGKKYYFPLQPTGGYKIGEYFQSANGTRIKQGLPASHHSGEAIDIPTKVGTSVVAVTSGKITEISWKDRFSIKEYSGGANSPYKGGLWVTIVGEDGCRYHTSHLSKVAEGLKPGQAVYAGQLIGYSGATGNARTLVNTYPHLHFGLSHPTDPAQLTKNWAIRTGEFWPQEAVGKWLAGVDFTPKCK